MSDIVSKTFKLWSDVWADDTVKDRLSDDPAAVIAEYGIDAGNAQVDVHFGDANLIDWSKYGLDIDVTQGLDHEQFKSNWPTMIARGRVVVMVPDSANDELNEDELELVAGGQTKKATKKKMMPKGNNGCANLIYCPSASSLS